MKNSCSLLHFLMLTLVFGCASMDLELNNWQKLPKEHYTIPPYARYLKEYKIAIDPGHGGNAHLPGYKRGPTGRREAVMNLNVARFLKEFLEKAGAEVFLTREDDRFVALQERVELAEEAGCDLMLSLHHNASNNPQTNYAAVFYHLTPDTSPISMDLARNIYFGLVDALHLPQVVDDGLLTDKIIYPAGFGLLRRSRIPAILLESSFYSHAQEEKRLSNLRYNRREAYGIFLGLARWVAGGVPSARKLSPATISDNKRPTIEYQLRDGISERGGRNLDRLLIFSQSVAARIDGQHVPVELSEDRSKVAFQPDTLLTNGIHTLQVDLQNLYKNHNFPRLDTLIISAPTDSIDFQVATPYVPADTLAQIPIRLALFDKDGELVWDSTRVELRATRGRVEPARPRLHAGRTTVYYRSGAEIGLAYVTAASGATEDTLLLSLTPTGQSWIVSGTVIDDSTLAPIAGATVTLNESISALTDENGTYFFANPTVGGQRLIVSKDGYEAAAQGVHIDSSRSQLLNFRLKAHLGGLLHNEVIILDAALGDTATGAIFSDSLNAAQANLQLVQQLAATLRRAGSHPVLVRDKDRWLSSRERIKQVNELPEGWYLKFGYEKWDSDSLFVQTTIYPANKTGEKIATHVLQAFSTRVGATGELRQNTEVPEVTYTNKTAVEVIVKCRQPLIRERDLKAIFAAIVDFRREEFDN